MINARLVLDEKWYKSEKVCQMANGFFFVLNFLSVEEHRVFIQLVWSRGRNYL